MLGRFFPSHPWAAGWKGPMMDPGFQPEGPLQARLIETAKAVFTFAFVPHDWPAFHGDVPVFGFLFTLSLLMLPFLRGGRRVWLLAGSASLGVFVWYWTVHQDRYLQALLPWMVACAAATLMLVWSAGRWARIGVALLLALQLIWGGDVPFLPTHTMMNEVPAKRAITLLSSTFRGDWDSRFHRTTGFEGLPEYLPKDAVVLLHEEYLRFGLARPVVGDSARWQGGIHYPVLAQSDRIFDLLRSYGVTHIVWQTSQSINREIPVSGELIFYDFVFHHGMERRYFGGYGVVRLPGTRPVGTRPGMVAYLGCRGQNEMTLSELDAEVGRDDGVPRPQEADVAARISRLVDSAAYVVIREGCQNPVPPSVAQSFEAAPSWGALSLWVRR
jgi:hypothetical protein